MSMLRSRLVVLAGILIAGTSLHVALDGDLTADIPHFFGAAAVMFALYAMAVFLFARMRPTRRWLIFIVAVAVLSRVVMIAATPSLSDDIYRYVWEGRVMRAGYNPFVYAPDSPELELLRDANYQHVNHRELATIYPPLAQAVFAVGVSIAANVMVQKILFVLFDLATLALVILLLRARGLSTNLSVIYAWNPLIIVEIAHSGHMDSVGIFFLVLALCAFQRAKYAGGMMAVALSFLAKLLPVILAPYFILRRKYVMWVPVALAVAVLGYLPFARAGEALWSSLLVYGQHWTFNSLVYRLATYVIADPQHIRIGLAAAVALFSLHQAIRTQDLVRFTFRVVGCALLLSPTIYPWYLCWIVPLLCFHRSVAWMYLTAAVMVSYWVWMLSEWRLGTGFLAGEYGLFYALLVWELVRAWRRHRGSAATAATLEDGAATAQGPMLSRGDE